MVIHGTHRRAPWLEHRSRGWRVLKGQEGEQCCGEALEFMSIGFEFSSYSAMTHLFTIKSFSNMHRIKWPFYFTPKPNFKYSKKPYFRFQAIQNSPFAGSVKILFPPEKWLLTLIDQRTSFFHSFFGLEVKNNYSQVPSHQGHFMFMLSWHFIQLASFS